MSDNKIPIAPWHPSDNPPEPSPSPIARRSVQVGLKKSAAFLMAAAVEFEKIADESFRGNSTDWAKAMLVTANAMVGDAAFECDQAVIEYQKVTHG